MVHYLYLYVLPDCTCVIYIQIAALLSVAFRYRWRVQFSSIIKILHLFNLILITLASDLWTMENGNVTQHFSIIESTHYYNYKIQHYGASMIIRISNVARFDSNARKG